MVVRWGLPLSNVNSVALATNSTHTMTTAHKPAIAPVDLAEPKDRWMRGRKQMVYRSDDALLRVDSDNLRPPLQSYRWIGDVLLPDWAISQYRNLNVPLGSLRSPRLFSTKGSLPYQSYFIRYAISNRHIIERSLWNDASISNLLLYMVGTIF